MKIELLVENIIKQRKEKHLQKLGNIINQSAFLIEKERFDKEYTFLSKKLGDLTKAEYEPEKERIYRDILIYIGETNDRTNNK